MLASTRDSMPVNSARPALRWSISSSSDCSALPYSVKGVGVSAARVVHAGITCVSSACMSVSCLRWAYFAEGAKVCASNR